MVPWNESDFKKRRFPRLKTPVFYRPSNVFGTSCQASDLSLGGIRVYSNKPLKEKQLLDIELSLPSGKSIQAVTRVVWIKGLPPGSRALYDVGLEFVNLSADALDQLRSILDAASSEA